MTNDAFHAQQAEPSRTAVTLADAEPVALRRTNAGDYCRGIQRARHNEFWWYFNGLVARRNYWKPFQDPAGRWWWFVKPWFAWPVDFFSAVSDSVAIRHRRFLLGWQYPVVEDVADSCVRLNVVPDLSGYDLDRIERKKRRHAIRRALRELRYEIVNSADPSVAEQACTIWNSHVQRTGWNRTMPVGAFVESWIELAAIPGTTVVFARDPAQGGLPCAWLITRGIDHTLFIDTIASHTDRLALGPNDGLIFLALWSAAKMRMAHAHYGLQSSIETLEDFKRSLGFEPHPFPTKLRLRFPVEVALRLLRPRVFRRLRGDWPLRAGE